MYDGEEDGDGMVMKVCYWNDAVLRRNECDGRELLWNNIVDWHDVRVSS
jgi:hypothetical protein